MYYGENPEPPDPAPPESENGESEEEQEIENEEKVEDAKKEDEENEEVSIDEEGNGSADTDVSDSDLLYIEDYDIEDYDIEDVGTPIFAFAVTSQRVCLFEPFNDRLLIADRSNLCLKHLKANRVYSISRANTLTTLSKDRLKLMMCRDRVVFNTEAAYHSLVLPALLLGSRVRDFEQRCATVLQRDSLVLAMPSQAGRLTTLRLATVDGDVFDVAVVGVSRQPKQWRVTCASRARLPPSVRPGAQLELLSADQRQPRVTAALMAAAAAAEDSSSSWPLLRAIYSAPCAASHHPPTPRGTVTVLLRTGATVTLNPEQAEAVHRYNADSCRAFVVEAPPGSGKTLTAAAMAISYQGHGVQLFLSTANVPVANIALALARLDYGHLSIIHLVSSEREAQMAEESRSPFSLLSLAMASNGALAGLDAALRIARGEKKRRLKAAISQMCAPLLTQRYDVIMGTVDMVLGYLLKPRNRREPPDAIKRQLADVQRVCCLFIPHTLLSREAKEYSK